MPTLAKEAVYVSSPGLVRHLRLIDLAPACHFFVVSAHVRFCSTHGLGCQHLRDLDIYLATLRCEHGEIVWPTKEEAA